MRPAAICVFCASHDGAHPAYRQAAVQLGTLIAESGFGLVYGGATTGLMGAVADAAIAGGAAVVGVLPAVLRSREIAHPGLTELHHVGSMHERKAMMVARADAFVALPGGFGTLDEFVEVVTWSLLGTHSKPCVLVNIRGYFDHLLRFLDHAGHEGFIRPEHRAAIKIVADPEAAMALLRGSFEMSESPLAGA